MTTDAQTITNVQDCHGLSNGVLVYWDIFGVSKDVPYVPGITWDILGSLS